MSFPWALPTNRPRCRSSALPANSIQGPFANERALASIAQLAGKAPLVPTARRFIPRGAGVSPAIRPGGCGKSPARRRRHGQS